MTAIRFIFLVILMSLAAASAKAACRQVEHLGQSYTVCSFDPAVEGIRLYNKDPDGVPYRTFRDLAHGLKHEREFMIFAMNGGMYHDDLSPVGLHVEFGKETKAASSAGGWGNFHLLPNGIFYVEAGRAGVMETKAYLASGVKPLFATQSGPMLVIDGRLHPRFLPGSDSFKVRNGVGVDRRGIVHFALSNEAVRFHDFGTLYRDMLDCPNALFLDGTISSLYAPEIHRHDRFFPMGPIIAVVRPLPG